jgi:hypothetical protein
MKTLFALMIVALLTGCAATPYQPMGFTGGYEDTHIKDNIYYVSFQANANTSHTTAAQYFNRRAKEVCLENGYQDYRLYGERDTSGAFGTYGGGQAHVSGKPGFASYVECLKK